MRVKWISSVVILLGIMLTGCTAQGLNPRKKDLWGCSLRITASSWSGWEEGYQPEEITYEFEMDAPEKIMVPPEDGFEITITGINANGIAFKTESPMAPYGRTINLESDQTTFIVYEGQILSLVTPTTDCGLVYIIELVKTFRTS